MKAKEPKPQLPATHKTAIIQALFDARWDDQTKTLSRPMVTLGDLAGEIRRYNEQHHERLRRNALSEKNPANFYKDFVRTSSRNQNWPAKVWEKGYTARQVTGQGNAFEFVPREPGQATPFAEEKYPRDQNCPRHDHQSLSLLPLARAFGQEHETWLMQVAVHLHLIETHLALHSAQGLEHVSHLQMGIKQSRTEIDGLYLGQYSNGDEAVITVEAKGKKDDILEDQVRQQAKAVLEMERLKEKKCVIPVAIKVIGDSRVYVREYEPIAFGQGEAPDPLPLASEAVFTLKPPVPGIK